MNTQQAFINGFVKRASEYGLNQNEAFELLKSSGLYDTYIAPAVDKAKAFVKNQMTDPLVENTKNPDFNKNVKQNYYKPAPTVAPAAPAK